MRNEKDVHKKEIRASESGFAVEKINVIGEKSF